MGNLKISNHGEISKSSGFVPELNGKEKMRFFIDNGKSKELNEDDLKEAFVKNNKKGYSLAGGNSYDIKLKFT